MGKIIWRCPLCDEIVIERDPYLGDRELFNQKLDCRAMVRHLEEKHKDHPEVGKYIKKFEEEEKALDEALAEMIYITEF